MYLIHLLAVIFTLFTTQTLAQGGCGPVTFKQGIRYQRISNCNLNEDNVFLCGRSGLSVEQEDSKVVLRAGSIHSTILVTCANYWVRLYHCPEHQVGKFEAPPCEEHSWKVETIKQLFE